MQPTPAFGTAPSRHLTAGVSSVNPPAHSSALLGTTVSRSDHKHEPVDPRPLSGRATRRVDQSADRAFQALRRVATRPQPYRGPAIGELVAHALDCVARARRLPTGDEARALARSLEHARKEDLAQAGLAVEDYLAQTLQPEQLASEPARQLIRQVFISQWRSPDQRPGSVALGLLARSPQCASLALSELFVAALQVPAHVTAGVLGPVRDNLPELLHPETSVQQVLDALASALRTTCHKDFRSQEPGLLAASSLSVPGLSEPANVEKEVLGWVMALLELCEATGLPLTGEHGVRLAPVVREVAAGMETLPTARVRSLLGGLTTALDLDSLQLMPRYPVPQLLRELPSTATWMPVLSAVQSGTGAFIELVHGQEAAPWPWDQAMALRDAVPAGMRLGALAAIFQVHASMDYVKSLGGLAASTSLQTLAEHAAQLTLMELACAALGVELLASLGPNPGDGKSPDERWQAVLASTRLAPGQAERLRWARGVAAGWVGESATLVAFPGLSASERLQLLSIIHLSALLEDPAKAHATVASLSLLEGLGPFRAPLLVMAALDRQTALGVEAFAQVNAALLDRAVAGPARVGVLGDSKGGTPTAFAGAKEHRKVLEDDDDAPMRQALGGWRLKAVGQGVTQPLADVRSFYENYVDSCGLLHLCRLPAHGLHPDDVRTSRPRVMHVFRQLTEAASQVRARFAGDALAQQYLLEPLARLETALHAAFDPFTVTMPPSHRYQSLPGRVQGPDPDKPATL